MSELQFLRAQGGKQQMVETALRQWRRRMEFTQKEAAEALGVAVNTFQAVERGISYNTGKPIALDRRTALACAALEARLKPITADDGTSSIP
jgi:DNA-binding XRE family transcriptional regulator